MNFILIYLFLKLLFYFENIIHILKLSCFMFFAFRSKSLRSRVCSVLFPWRIQATPVSSAGQTVSGQGAGPPQEAPVKQAVAVTVFPFRGLSAGVLCHGGLQTRVLL